MNADGLYTAHAAGGIVEALAAGFLQPRSRFYRDTAILDRIRLAAGYLERSQTPDGNIDLVTTNFNSPPDTAFVVECVATAANLARRSGQMAVFGCLEKFLRGAGSGMSEGGVHTPNHRWVLCSALAQLHELFGEPEYVRRIDQWLAEGVDIDADGQWTERSTTVYNAVCDRSYVTMARKLNRPNLLEPVRRNLDAMMYLLHPNGEVVTEISRRQDRNERGDLGRYWFPLVYLAHRDRNGRYSAMAGQVAGKHATLPLLMEYPELQKQMPAATPLPDDFERAIAVPPVVRIRRGPASATLMLQGNSRLFSLHCGNAAIRAVRFAGAFFGIGQFVPANHSGKWDLSQSIQADYVQPFDPPVSVGPSNWYELRSARKRSEISKIDYRVSIRERPNAFWLRFTASGTSNVPCAVEINTGDGELEGCTRLRDDVYLLERGAGRLQNGDDAIRFGPGAASHRYVDIRGGEPKLPGRSVYVTGTTPFDYTLKFEW